MYTPLLLKFPVHAPEALFRTCNGHAGLGTQLPSLVQPKLTPLLGQRRVAMSWWAPQCRLERRPVSRSKVANGVARRQSICAPSRQGCHCSIISCGWRPAQTFRALRFTAGRWAAVSSQANALQEAECEELLAPESAPTEDKEHRSGQASR